MAIKITKEGSWYRVYGTSKKGRMVWIEVRTKKEAEAKKRYYSTRG